MASNVTIVQVDLTVHQRVLRDAQCVPLGHMQQLVQPIVPLAQLELFLELVTPLVLLVLLGNIQAQVQQVVQFVLLEPTLQRQDLHRVQVVPLVMGQHLVLVIAH
jgi:hypothetical protein